MIFLLIKEKKKTQSEWSKQNYAGIKWQNDGKYVESSF